MDFSPRSLTIRFSLLMTRAGFTVGVVDVRKGRGHRLTFLRLGPQAR